MYTPDRAFVAKLKALDPKLNCEYRPSIERFVITYERPYRGPAIVHSIRGPFGEFRHPDERDIKILQDGDLHNPKVRTEILELADYYDRLRATKEKYRRDEMRHMIRDCRRQLLPAFARAGNTGGKNNSTFRRVVPKVRGKVFG